ncbi:MAG: potassium channel protein [Candidatus Brocadia sp.]|nr:hypothetical protein [Candidatus Brocadia fulgida]MCC6325297.1 ion transporter [Candidatus Brocadia sp.]MCE7912339.1 ion transporter [Candidatus Brocadia sp. AMX3]MDG5996902.1 ion transporter [Candidatus Brocadia sp.]RIJ97789.1 MAG: potassium channel protein [Candidatus Brocadia sp.]
MKHNIKSSAYKIMHEVSNADTRVRAFHVSLTTLILLNVLAVILETVESIATQYRVFFTAFDVFSIGVFTIEYLLRLWTCTADARFRGAVKGRARFTVTPFSLIDLMAILPFYLPMFLPLDLRFIRALRLFRLFRILKMGRYSESIRTLGNVLKEEKEALAITVFAVLILLVVASSLMYFVENAAQPEAFSSIPEAMWWGVATLTTVGYGDICPITPLGRFLGAIIALLGIGTIAVPAGIVTSGFAREIQKKHGKRGMCPYCGKEMAEPPERSSTSK